MENLAREIGVVTDNQRILDRTVVHKKNKMGLMRQYYLTDFHIVFDRKTGQTCIYQNLSHCSRHFYCPVLKYR